MANNTNSASKTPATSADGFDLTAVKKVRVHHLAAAKASRQRLTMLTAYDSLSASIFDAAGIDLLLVGDSMGNVMLGYANTLPVTLAEILVATRAVASTTKRAFIVADMPFGTYETGPEIAFTNAAQLIRVGANAVKIEGGTHLAPHVEMLTRSGIPVIAHLGFTPQAENTLGGKRVQGRANGAEEKLLADAQALVAAGAAAVVVEMIPAPVAARLTAAIPVPVIGIGAGPQCDGQVLVWTDMAGMTDWSPSFAKQFGQVGRVLQQAATDYGQAVRDGSFPAETHCFQA